MQSQKIKALSRSLDVHAPARQGDPAPLSRNLDPALHPFDKPREYTRALNAAKLDRLFAKPFVGALEGHIDGIYSIAKDTNRLNVVASGSGDGGKSADAHPFKLSIHLFMLTSTLSLLFFF